MANKSDRSPQPSGVGEVTLLLMFIALIWMLDNAGGRSKT